MQRSVPEPLFSITSIQRNILETQIEYPGIVLSDISIKTAFFDRYTEGECFIISMDETVNTPCLTKCLMNSVINIEDIGNNQSINDKINLCVNKEDAYHKDSKLLYAITLSSETSETSETSRNACVFVECSNLECKEFEKQLPSLKQDVHLDLTNALFKSEKRYNFGSVGKALFKETNLSTDYNEEQSDHDEMQVEGLVRTPKIATPNGEGFVNGIPLKNFNPDKCKLSRKRKIQHHHDDAFDNDIWGGDAGLANIFWKQTGRESIIICGENLPGYIWNTETCLWEMCSRGVMAKHVFDVIKIFLVNLNKTLFKIRNKTEKQKADLQQTTLLINKVANSVTQSTVFKQVECTKAYIISDIGLKKNLKPLSLINNKSREIKGKKNLSEEDSMSHLYPIQDCKVLNFLDKTVRTRVPNDFFTFECPLNYVKMEETHGFPNAIKFFSSISCGDMELVKYHQRMLGYCLTGEITNRSLYIHWGSQGKNGKSTLWKIMQKILNKFFAECSDRVLIHNNTSSSTTPELCALIGTRVALVSETEKGASLNVVAIKKLTGDDNISARQLYGQTFQFKPVCKIVLMTNNKPIIDAEENPMWDRVKLIAFNARFQESADSEEYVKSLLNEHLDEIFSFLVEGAHEYFLTKTIPLPKALEREIANYRKDQDSLIPFIDECCDIQSPGESENVEYILEKKVAFQMYSTWARENGQLLLSNREFYISFEKRFPLPSNKINCKKSINNVRKNYFFGVRSINDSNVGFVVNNLSIQV